MCKEVMWLHTVVFIANLPFTAVKGSLAKMLTKKGVVDNRTNGYNEDKLIRPIWQRLFVLAAWN